MDVIIRPIITEQAMKDAELGKFTFAVARFANKYAIKKAVEDMFHVHVTSIATIVVKGGRARIGKRREEVKRTPWKKAVVQLTKGQKIAAFDTGATEGEESGHNH